MDTHPRLIGRTLHPLADVASPPQSALVDFFLLVHSSNSNSMVCVVATAALLAGLPNVFKTCLSLR